jgi:DNA-binding MurR/RpiR family transcriptional regulator
MKTEQQKQFATLFLTGKYQQKEIAKRVGVSEVTASRWVKEMQVLDYFKARKALSRTLAQVSKEPYTESSANVISLLLSNIERLESLIRKAKYIPHLQRQL